MSDERKQMLLAIDHDTLAELCARHEDEIGRLRAIIAMREADLASETAWANDYHQQAERLQAERDAIRADYSFLWDEHKKLQLDVERLTAELDAAKAEVEQLNDDVQRNWLSPVEAVGLRRALERGVQVRHLVDFAAELDQKLDDMGRLISDAVTGEAERTQARMAAQSEAEER